MYKLSEKFSKWAAAVASASLVFVMVVTFIDVVGRYVFNTPLTYSVELTKLAMGLVILLGLGLTTFYREHISVDLIPPLLPKSAQSFLRRVSAFTGVVFLGMIAWNFWGKVVAQQSDGLVTQILAMPVYPFTLVMAIGASFSALLSLYFVFMPSLHPNDKSD
ncbi:MAG: TRAP transporter small permease [Rhizobiaceae bacterium]|nr:TRAP transporter small permease [Rhizobiaceae bacterium]MBL4695568.1 TRAP transporter small permease [Rhizobiaceae bacterium]